MSARPPLKLSSERFRLNPVFRVVAIEELTAAELQQLGGVRSDGELEAVLMPTVSLFSAKAICENTAKLIESLRVASHPPRDLSDPNLLVRLVLDSVLEIEHDGQFLSGAQAAGLMGLASIDEFPDLRAPARLSREALNYSEALDLSDPPTLSAKLYFYNRTPISPNWTRRIGTPEGLASWMGLDTGTRLRAQLDRDWIETASPPENPAWRRFRLAGYEGGSRFKLYVNPRPNFLRAALEVALPILSECGFGVFKVGRDLSGVLRPDKFVAYAASREQIDSASQALLLKLSGMPAQAVPFTGAIDDDGLVSWGMDPPRTERVSFYQGTSWRHWITDKLAVALIAGRAGGASSPSRFALQRVALEGIDVNSWTPNEVAWAKPVTR